MKTFSKAEIADMSYHELCGKLDCLPDDHPSIPDMQAAADARRAANPKLKHYAEGAR